MQEFIDSLSKRVDRVKILQVFEAVETMQVVPKNVLKKMSGQKNLWEIRVGPYRFLGFYDGAKLVLVRPFVKQSQKTPTDEIEVALLRRKAYFGKARGIPDL